MKTLELDNLLGFLFHNIHLTMRKRLENDIKKFNLLTAYQLGMLILLSKKSMSQKEISNITLKDEPSTKRMLDRMIKKDLIVKQRNLEDKRKQVVSLTNKGKKLFEQILPIVLKNSKNTEDLLSKNELEILFKLLNKINNNL